MSKPEYIGDGVYAQKPNNGLEDIVITTGCHLSTPEYPSLQEPDNAVFMDPVVLAKFIEWVRRLDDSE